MSDSTRAVGAAAITVVLWASAFVAIRSAGGQFAPGALALGRLLIASLALGLLWLVSGEGVPPRAAWPGIAGSGLLWFGLYMITLNWGERDVDAGTAAMVVNIGPILIALLGGWLLCEGFPGRLAAGMVVWFAGAVVVGVSESGGGRTSIAGVVLCLAAAVCYAAGVVFQKPALRHASAVQVTTFGCFAGTVACLPFAGQFASQLGSAPASATLNVVYLGLFPTTLGFTTWAYALARTTSGKMGATTYAVPGLVVVMSWLFLGQVPKWLTVVGGLLCLAGVAVSRSRTTVTVPVPASLALMPPSPGEDPVPVRERLATERERALARAAALEREFASYAEAASAAGTDDEHDPEGATLAFERQHAAALLAQAREQVTAVDEALRRLDHGEYGGCERCGLPIGSERLAARPTARTCIACASRL